MGHPSRVTRAAARSAEAGAEHAARYIELLAMIGRIDINSVQALLLFNVGDDEVTAGELKTRGYYQGSNVSYNLKKLVEAGYLHHERSAVDRRSVRIRLTSKGRAVRDVVAELFERHAEALGEDAELGSERMAELNGGLRRIERFWMDRIRYIY